MYYFMLAPTLCYELNFPRTKKIRKRFLIKRAVEMVFLFTLWFILINQWMVPILQNSQQSFRETHVVKIVERLMKFAVTLFKLNFKAYKNQTVMDFLSFPRFRIISVG